VLLHAEGSFLPGVDPGRLVPDPAAESAYLSRLTCRLRWLCRYVQWFCSQGFYPCQTGAATAVVLAVAALLAAAVESLPIENVLNDNPTVPLTVAAVVHFSYLGR
jgi:hypothetical protein